MLTEGNLRYLETISDSEPARIAEFNPASQKTAQKILSELRKALPSAQVIYFGSSALGIAGENDIDLGVTDVDEYSSGAQNLRTMYGEPIKIDEKNRVFRWEFMRDGFIVEMFLTDVLAGRRLQHIKNHERMAENADLRKKYEELKISSRGLSKREYMKKKLEFFNGLD